MTPGYYSAGVIILLYTGTIGISLLEPVYSPDAPIYHPVMADISHVNTENIQSNNRHVYFMYLIT